MLDIMNQAKNAIAAYNDALKITSSNIANMNVTGYKKLDASFQSIFEKVLNGGTPARNGFGGTNPLQFGQGMGLAGVAVDFSAGEYVDGTGPDLAISGQGLFIVSPDGGNSFLYTRAGNFQLDANGNLLSNGMQVYGLDDSGAVVPIANLPSGNRSNYKWLADGTLQYTADGVTYINTGYHIALTYFPNPNGLAQAQNSSFAATVASGNPADAQTPGGLAGSILPGKTEQSNVDYLSETINALDLQKAINADLTILKMASDMITSFISKLS